MSRRIRKYQGQFFLYYLVWYGLGRTMIESLRSDSLWLIPGVVRISQLLAAATCLGALLVLTANRSRLKRGKPLLLGVLDSPAEAEL